jgi:hypothetical protein
VRPEAENKFFHKDLDIQVEFIDGDSFNLIEDGEIAWTAKRVK